MKKITAVFLLILLVIPTFTLGINAETIVDSGTIDNLTWKLDNQGTLTISGEGDMKNFSSQSYNLPPWDKSTIKSIIISDGVTSIGSYAFYGCSYLINVSLADSVVKIYPYAFGSCISLISVAIPDAVDEIGQYAFSYCSSLTKIDLPQTITSIYNNTFSGCESLVDIILPETLTSIGSSAFSSCKSITSFIIPENVKTLGSSVFLACSSLTTLTILSNSLNLVNSTFSGCYNLTYLYIPNGIDIKTSWDIGLSSVKYIYTDNLNTWLNTSSNLKISASDYNLYFNNNLVTNVNIPSDKTSISDYAFYGCSSLLSVTLESGINSIGKNAFSRCTALHEINLPDSLLTIYDQAFSYNSSLKLIEMPNNLTYIGKGAFYGCDTLESITIPPSIEAIYAETFYGCESLTDINLPKSLKIIGPSVFQNCQSLTNIVIPTGITSISSSVFRDSGLKIISFSKEVTVIGEYAFYNTPLEKVYYSGKEIDKTAIVINPGNTRFSSAEWFYGHAEHNYIKTVVLPTCTEKGYTEYKCSICGDIYTSDFVDAYQHNYTKTIISPNCVNDGYTENKCKRCGYTYKSDFTNATGKHDYVSTVVVPTCTIKGYTLHKCSVCNYLYKTDETPALGHKWIENGIVKEPTMISDGTMLYKCSVCGATKTAPIPSHMATCPSKKMVDVDKTAWYHEAVDNAIENGLFAGTSETTFEPNTDMSRAMLVTVLYKMEGSPSVSYKGTFTDVKNRQWYTAGVIWAADNGIVSGYGNGIFDPNGKITREQLASILFRYTAWKGRDTSASSPLDKFVDADDTSEWAASSVKWAVAEGFISGTGVGLAPKGNASRAQAASVLMRYQERYLAA